ncbi:mitosis inhibitor protein kinase swe1 [Exophiala sideris]|uniref:Mitosis inhibitor protein kinase swe1 n=1 Tax=Exophiala sideris TaxID=1016849 RepID=A0ABR0J7D8_9EURO|nr:mitosis inhibitor protein kinase swe1 [Exophiala sideris]KAK5058073.1 mitosis inhibitor protein kinase swe1 [Exophiala sideris]KAK5182032.1 mitosis inhibitor protein kinase swe1 [Eurotiomycetes sp. CCFEE 6388]
MATCSPHREDAETAHLHSPKSLSRFDPHSAIREIRRSLSRSPSKGSELRQFPLRSPGPGTLPFSPSPLSPSRKSTSDNLWVPSMVSSHSPRVPPGSRFQRPVLRRTAPLHGKPRVVRTSPKSPSKRALADLSDGGNSSPMPLRKRSSGEADREAALESLTAEEGKENDRSSEDGLNYKPATSRQEKRRSGGALINMTVPLSPMKRTDAPTNDDTPGLESPSVKRRSIHGPGLDFSIFESDGSDGNMFLDRRAQDDNDWFGSNTPLPSPAARFSTIPRRSSSLRKSTLQQRQVDRPSNLKYNQTMEVDRSIFEPTPATSKKPLRMSLDNHIQPLPRDSPFSSQGNLLSASIHPVPSSQGSFPQQSRHPLSRTLTQSSSQMGDQDDSPTHEPIHRPNRPRSHDFSKSLPIGSLRPTDYSEGNEFSSQNSFATPGNYKAAKPLPAAFMSTGLISKKNRNVDDPDAGLPKAHMPDTPCKRQSTIFPTDDKFAPANVVGIRGPRQSFGASTTPLEVQHGTSKVSAFPFSKSIGIFGARPNKQSLAPESSFTSIDVANKASDRSSFTRAQSQSTDSDYPPTPTRHFVDPEDRDSVSPSPHHSALAINSAVPRSAVDACVASTSPRCVDRDSDSVMEDSPSANLRPKSSLNIVSTPGVSYTESRMSKNLGFPRPLSRKSLSIQPLHSPALERTKMKSVSPVSPRIDGADRITPQTPLEGFFFPPDPSRLTISGRPSRMLVRRDSGNSAIIPATPTGPKEQFANFSNRPSLNLAAADTSNVDDSLSSRFEKVDLIGSGEFSQVYRASQPPEVSPYHKIYSVSTSRPSSRSSLPEKVWAVKKSRYPYTGAKDRARKIYEVDVLKAMGHSDHIVTFVDSWEEQGHLYIQTEFCEEGTLDVFLAQVGLKARLDDFRIWKILLELSHGLKHVHDSGFIHLDLKPANILITFEGVLKIADFGMACKWPAKSGIEGEGDREYMAPEVLMGKYDKPADMFALGLIMLETAGNVALPDNGVSWQKLRNGDMSDVPSLTWSSGGSSVLRDASGNPVSEESFLDANDDDDPCDVDVVDADEHDHGTTKEHHDKALHYRRSGELTHAPQFMIDPLHEQALERVVGWMISPDPDDRPLVNDVLNAEGVRFADARRRAGATIFEGNWGPADEILAEDAEMIDV